ncbi:diguanylate cyclase [Rhodoferax sp. 4810]|nr:diguanylate cyclase [Rhodoferax jenense]
MSTSHPTSIKRQKNAMQWLLLALVLVTLGALTAGAQWRDYREVESAEREQLRTLTRMTDKLLTTQIQSADAALRTMLASMERWRGTDGNFQPFAHEHLLRVANMMPGTRTFAVMGPDGICQLSNRTDLLGQDFSHRDYFQHAAADRTDKWLHIPPPYKTVLNVWTITLSRAIIRPNGQFGGVVVATLSPDFFESVMNELRYAADMRVTMVHDEGPIYATSPPNLEQMSPERMAKRTFFREHIEAGLPETDHWGPGLDDNNRIGVARTVALANLHATHQFVVIASREAGAVLGSWRTMTGVLFGLWLTMVSGSIWGLARHQKSSTRLRSIANTAEQALRYSNQRYEQLANTIPCLLFDFEASAAGGIKVTYVGPYSQTLVGIAPEVLLADSEPYMQCIHEDDRATFQAIMDGAIAARMGYACEYRFWLPSGEMRWLKTTATPGTSAEGSGVTHFSGFVIDITDTKNQQQLLREMAYQDPLTLADNRRSFLEKLQAELARVHRYGEQASLLMLDIDFFKQVNDTYGHQVGDAVLKHLVALMHGVLRSLDSVGRLGGEEFAVLLPDTGTEAALQLAERLRLAVQLSPALEAGQTVYFTISLGVVAITADLADTKTVLHQADKAMYHAKQTGRNRVCTADEAPPTTLHSALD